jgi:hypothetical protein
MQNRILRSNTKRTLRLEQIKAKRVKLLLEPQQMVSGGIEDLNSHGQNVFSENLNNIFNCNWSLDPSLECNCHSEEISKENGNSEEISKENGNSEEISKENGNSEEIYREKLVATSNAICKEIKDVVKAAIKAGETKRYRLEIKKPNSHEKMFSDFDKLLSLNEIFEENLEENGKRKAISDAISHYLDYNNFFDGEDLIENEDILNDKNIDIFSILKLYNNNYIDSLGFKTYGMSIIEEYLYENRKSEEISSGNNNYCHSAISVREIETDVCTIMNMSMQFDFSKKLSMKEICINFFHIQKLTSSKYKIGKCRDLYNIILVRKYLDFFSSVNQACIFNDYIY